MRCLNAMNQVKSPSKASYVPNTDSSTDSDIAEPVEVTNATCPDKSVNVNESNVTDTFFSVILNAKEKSSVDDSLVWG